jgi:hypothetical protein
MNGMPQMKRNYISVEPKVRNLRFKSALIRAIHGLSWGRTGVKSFPDD